MKQALESSGISKTKARQALDGIRIADFSWLGALPMGITILANYGAEVIKIESREAIDFARLTAPYRDGIVGIDRSALFMTMSNHKYSIGLNLNLPQAQEVAKRLIAESDIVTESFRPGVLKKFGLDYEAVRKVKPDIIMLSSSILGQQGPESRVAAFGHHGGSLSGFDELIGWPDRAGVGAGIAYTDHVAPWYAVIAILAALDYRSRTGKGQYIDLSQTEVGVTLLQTGILDYYANGREPTRRGNQSNRAAPHGAYRCLGHDRWCTIAVFTEEEWQSFCRVLGDPAWTKEPKFATLADRLKNVEELDRYVEEWTAQRPAEDVMEVLQAAGVPAGVVQTSKDFDTDPQIAARGFFGEVDHPVVGRHLIPDPPCKLSVTPATFGRAPLFGEHTEWVCKEILKMSDGEFVELVDAGVLELN